MANATQEISEASSLERTVEVGTPGKEADAEEETTLKRPSLPKRLWDKTGLNVGLLLLMTKFVTIMILRI